MSARLTRRPSDRSITTTLALTGLIAAFMQTLATPIIPRLSNLVHTTTADATWVLTSTLLAAAISTPISGRLRDMYGKRRVVIVLLMLMAGGSIVSALSNTLIPMIVGRVFQGVGLGVIALGISILRDVIYPRNLGGTVALVSATLGVGGAIGFPVAALIAQNFDYHYLFWLAAGLAIVVIVLVAFFITTAALPVLLEAPTRTGVGLGQSLIASSLCLGGLIIGVAFSIATWLHGETWHVILVSAIVYSGVGFAYSAMHTLIMRVVPPTETAAANGLNSVMRTLGSTIAAFFIPRRGREYGKTASMPITLTER